MVIGAHPAQKKIGQLRRQSAGVVRLNMKEGVGDAEGGVVQPAAQPAAISRTHTLRGIVWEGHSESSGVVERSCAERGVESISNPRARPLATLSQRESRPTTLLHSFQPWASRTLIIVARIVFQVSCFSSTALGNM